MIWILIVQGMDSDVLELPGCADQGAVEQGDLSYTAAPCVTVSKWSTLKHPLCEWRQTSKVDVRYVIFSHIA